MNRCQCSAGFAQGECKKHGIPIIHTITDHSFCPICKIVELEHEIKKLKGVVKCHKTH